MLVIEPLQPDDTSELLKFAGRDERVAGVVSLLAEGSLEARSVFVAHREGQIVGVQICVPLPGKSCLFWLPIGDDESAVALVQAGQDWCQSLGCKIAQAFPLPAEAPRVAPFLSCGFRLVTRIQQLTHDLAGVLPDMTVDLRFTSYSPMCHELFARTLARTYEGTLDCPELNGIRTSDEILEGHRGEGRFRPEFWWLVHQGEEPVAIVLLIELRDGVSWELAYIGVVPEFRRRGIARGLMCRALTMVALQPATRLCLAVDERNEPALRLYRSLGFVDGDANEVLLRFL